MAEATISLSQSEALSALVDGEASELELRRLLKASEEDAQLKQEWQRYQLIGAAMRKDLPAVSYTDLSASISAAIAVDSDFDARSDNTVVQGAGKVAALWSTLGRVAVAASVAGAVVIGVQSYQSPLQPAAENIAAAVSSSTPSGLPIGYGAPEVAARTVSTAGYTPATIGRQVDFVPRQSTPVQPKSNAYNAELQAYLNHLMLEHAEHAALNASRGMMPFARVAELDTHERFDEPEGAVAPMPK